jgi:hypothetical protein
LLSVFAWSRVICRGWFRSVTSSTHVSCICRISPSTSLDNHYKLPTQSKGYRRQLDVFLPQGRKDESLAVLFFWFPVGLLLLCNHTKILC